MIVTDLFESQQQCPECGGVAFSNLVLAEKKDACYHKVKASAKVWPSAYASGRLVQCRKKGAANWGNKSESVNENQELYGLRVGDTVRATVNGKTVQGDVIDIFPDSMEVELLLRGANAGRTITVDVRDTEAMNEQGMAEGPGFDKWADDRVASQLHKLKPGMVQDRKTGKWYDPKKEFDKKMNSPEVMAQMKRMATKEGLAEGLSKRDQQDVAAIKAAIERLQAQLSHPNADKAAIQQSIAHEKKRLALYGQGVAEGLEQKWTVTVGTKTGGTSHTMTFTGTKEQAIKKAVARFGTSKNPVVKAVPAKQNTNEGMLDNPGEQDSPVAQAIICRILLQRTDLLSKYGPEKVGQAVDEVADFVGDVEEIGSSDVSGWIRHVEQMLGNMDQGVAEGAPIVVMPRADRLKKPEPTKVRYRGDIVPDTKPPSTEKRGVKGRPGQRPMPKHDVAEARPEPEQQAIDATRRARLQREREPQGSDKIDAMLAQQNAQRREYEQTGKFWLKQKDTQQHIGNVYVGKAAANTAALELLKQQPELRGNLVITAYGPGEQPG